MSIRASIINWYQYHKIKQFKVESERGKMADKFEHSISLSIHCYYMNETKAGIRACEKALLDGTPWGVENNIKSNYIFYMPLLEDIVNPEFFEVSIPPYKPKWSLFNPTVLLDNDKYLLLVRSSNYEIVDGRYVMVDNDNDIQTQYKMITMDSNGRFSDLKSISSPKYEKSNFPADGLEDLRIFTRANKYYVSGTIRNMIPYTNMARIAYCELDIKTGNLGEPIFLESPISKDRHEKNWMPIIGSESGEFLYQLNESGWTSVIAVEGKDVSIVSQNKAPAIASGFRGGSQVVPVDDGHICCIHEVCIVPGGARNYYHRFIRLDNRFRITDISIPFFLKHRQDIEFVAGMAFNKKEREYIVTFGIKDRSAWVVKLDEQSMDYLFDYRSKILTEERGLERLTRTSK